MVQKITSSFDAARTLTAHEYLTNHEWVVVWTGNVSATDSSGETITLLPDSAIVIANSLSGYWEALEAENRQLRARLASA
jgi:uncharacterized cupin superfamily protein